MSLPVGRKFSFHLEGLTAGYVVHVVGEQDGAPESFVAASFKEARSVALSKCAERICAIFDEIETAQ